MPRLTLRHLLLLLPLIGSWGCSSAHRFNTFSSELHPDQDPARLAWLSVPEELEVAMVDGREPDITGLISGDIDLAFLPGEHEVTFAYVQLLRSQYSEVHTTVRSNPITLRVDFAAGGRYRLEYPRQSELVAAQQFAKEPKVWVEDLNGGERQQHYVDAVSHQGLLTEPRERLRFWWGQADKATREAFLDWASHYNETVKP